MAGMVRNENSPIGMGLPCFSLSSRGYQVDAVTLLARLQWRGCLVTGTQNLWPARTTLTMGGQTVKLS